uniref:Uncharacterized protein n=1 Tax=Romanomermis culicivorax TaxID=13658 RepID=A0A915KYD5_ROMCU
MSEKTSGEGTTAINEQFVAKDKEDDENKNSQGSGSSGPKTKLKHEHKSHTSLNNCFMQKTKIKILVGRWIQRMTRVFSKSCLDLTSHSRVTGISGYGVVSRFATIQSALQSIFTIFKISEKRWKTQRVIAKLYSYERDHFFQVDIQMRYLIGCQIENSPKERLGMSKAGVGAIISGTGRCHPIWHLDFIFTIIILDSKELGESMIYICLRDGNTSNEGQKAGERKILLTVQHPIMNVSSSYKNRVMQLKEHHFSENQAPSDQFLGLQTADQRIVHDAFHNFTTNTTQEYKFVIR